jgi:hypothetical protein
MTDTKRDKQIVALKNNKRQRQTVTNIYKERQKKRETDKYRQRKTDRENGRCWENTVGLFRVPRGQTNFYSKIYFLSKFQK